MATAEADPSPYRPADLAARRFSVVRRGYDPEEVRAFLNGVAKQLSRLQGEMEWLRARGDHVERRTASAQEAAYARLARDFVDVIRQADQTAQQVRAAAEEEARHVINSAHLEADRILVSAREEGQSVVAAAVADAERVAPRAGRPRSDRNPDPGRAAEGSALPPPSHPPVAPGRPRSAETTGELREVLWAADPPAPPPLEFGLTEVWQPNGNGRGPGPPTAPAPLDVELYPTLDPRFDPKVDDLDLEMVLDLELDLGEGLEEESQPPGDPDADIPFAFDLGIDLELPRFELDDPRFEP